MGAGLLALLIGGGADWDGAADGGTVVLLSGFGLLILGGLSESVLPRLEVLPEGKQTRRSKILRWARREVGWWVRNLLLVAVGVVLTLLAQSLVE
jgi:hypothetical protein